MNEHFIKNIEIKNFKCFEDFKAEGFGWVNLIGGKNNVGKTAFMEAVYIASFDKYSTDKVHPFLKIEYLRGRLNNNINLIELKKINDKYLNTKIDINGLRSTDLKQDDTISISETIKFEYNFNSHLYNFIPSHTINNDLIIIIFDKIKKQRRREELNKILNSFDKNILEFDVIENKPQVFLKNIEDFQDVSELGHGLKRYIIIISSILINKNSFLFLDELENGVHYSHLDKLWEIILTISKQQNVQVFATTHSKECIESYARVAKKLEDKEITFIELCKREEEIKAFVYPYDWFIDEIEQEHEVRGCL